MKTTLTIIAFLMAPLFSFGQDLISRGYTQTTIEKGSTFKKHKNGKLDSIVVAMYAVNYGNALIFAKLHDEIRITNAEDKHSVITIGLKNKKQVLTFFYNNKPAIIVENIDFNIGKLPKNTIITRSLSDNMIRTVSVTTNYGVFGDDNPDKTYKLFYGLKIRPDLDNLDTIFEDIGKFFSEKDALLKLYYRSYAEKFAPQDLAYFKTDGSGIITHGIALDYQNKKSNAPNTYDIYENGKIIRSGKENLANFQKTYQGYVSKLQE